MMQPFPGIYWFCTHCHAFLNRQAGFDDRLPRFPCAKCVHENIIGKDQLYLQAELLAAFRQAGKAKKG